MLGAALLSALPPAAAAAQASPGDREVLTTAAQVRGLSMDEASSGLPVRLEAVVTFYHHPFGMLFVRDTTGPLFVFVDRRTVPFPIHAGQRVALEARTVAGTFAPALAEARIQPLDEVGLPKPVPATLGEIATGTLDSEWVEVEGVVRSAAREGPFVRLNLQTPEGSITTRVLAREGLPLDRLVDSRVRAQGACGSVGSNRRQLAGALLWVPDAAHLVVEAPPPTDPFALEATPLASLMRFTSESPARHRAKVSGVVTLQQPGEGLFLQERDNAAYVETSEPIGLRPGDRVEAVGFPTMGGSSPVLKEGLLRRVRGGPEPRPLIVGAERARQGAYDGLLVTITGQLSDFVSSSNDLVLVLAEGQRTFSARLRGRAAGQAAILALAPGSLLRLTGVCVAVGVGTGEGRGFELLLRSSDDVAVLGSPSWWTASRVQLLLGATAVTFVAILGWVVALRRRVRSTDAALRDSEERYALAVRGTNDGIWDWDLRRDHLYLSPRWKEMLGYAEEDVGSSPADWFRLVHADDLSRLRAKLADHRAGIAPNFESEHRILHKDGSYRWMLSRGFALRDGQGTAHRMTGAQTDVTDRRSYDPLTGLPNRALFVERLEKTVHRSSRDEGHLFAVLFLDFDRFKIVNDSLGHLVGDRLLTALGARLGASVRPGDVVARFGGDEFAILLDEINGPEDAARVAERIQAALKDALDVDGNEVYTSASIGIALSSTGYERASDLLRDADTALYRAKTAGRARFEVFDETMRSQVTAILRTENDLRKAIERGEFRLHYQPIVELRRLTLVGFEALLRWEHPERGLLTPDAFLDLAEETGLIGPIGDWVLHEACARLRVWSDRFPGFRVTVGVNLSARQFGAPGLAERLETIVAVTGLDPSRLVIELTESAVMDTAEETVERLGRLRESGVRLHIDDFGTGYSSLTYLHRFPIDALKIDRSFVGTMERSPDTVAIVKAVLTLGHTLGLEVIAEGVETREQLDLLRTFGCDLGQGYYLSRPLAVADAERLIVEVRASGVPVRQLDMA